MRPIYNDELYHFGIPGMKWGHHKIKQLQKANDIYKKKIDKIANSKSAHKADVEAAKAANSSVLQRFGKYAASAAVATLVGDILTGRIKNYGNLSNKEIFDKVSGIGKRAVGNLVVEEVTARSVANKYNTKGERVKGSNKEWRTREQLVKDGVKAISTGIMLAPLVTMGLGTIAKVHNQKRRAAEEAFDRWGGRILTDKISDYSHIVPNVKYTVE